MTLAALTDQAMLLRQRFAEAAERKGQRGWTREEVMQGFVGDVGDLMKLTMAHAGIREIPGAEQKLGHELADCLWSVLVLAKLYEVDLEKEFSRMTAEVAQKLQGNPVL